MKLWIIDSVVFTRKKGQDSSVWLELWNHNPSVGGSSPSLARAQVINSIGRVSRLQRES